MLHLRQKKWKEAGMQHDSYNFPMQRKPHPPNAPYLETKKKCDVNAQEDKGTEVQTSGKINVRLMKKVF